MSVRQVVGIHSAKEALKVRHPNEIKKVFIKADWNRNHALKELHALASEKGQHPKEVSSKKLDRIHDHNQGICVEVECELSFDLKSVGDQSALLVLDGLEDPKNFGAIIRSAWLMGVDAIFIPQRRSVSLTPSVIKAASGGVEHVPVEVTSNLASCVERLKKHGFWVYGLDADGEGSIGDEKYSEKTAFILGREESGMRSSLKKVCDKTLFIPQKSKEASYNVSVATALALSEYFRQF